MKNSNVDYLHEKINLIAEDIQRLSNKIERPVVVAIDGASGSGKTTIAHYFEHIRPRDSFDYVIEG
jgi:ABC-type lipoprotein export system ATPase subunit